MCIPCLTPDPTFLPVPARSTRCWTAQTLRQQNRRFQGTGGVSAENRSQGFAPAFLDTETHRIYRACFADGRPAPMHLLEGLPPAVVTARDATGRVIALKSTVLAGFVRAERFYTREQAAAHIIEGGPRPGGSRVGVKFRDFRSSSPVTSARRNSRPERTDPWRP
jgi:hypothetical protein